MTIWNAEVSILVPRFGGTLPTAFYSSSSWNSVSILVPRFGGTLLHLTMMMAKYHLFQSSSPVSGGRYTRAELRTLCHASVSILVPRFGGTLHTELT